MRVAIVHEWLTQYVGSERVLEQLLALYPEADLYCLFDFLPEEQRGFLQGRRPRTSFLQHLPFARKAYRKMLALMPMAVETFDLQNYDLVLSSSHAVAKGAITGPDQLHICYCHTPVRYAWDLQHEYLRESGMDSGIKGWAARAMLHYVRMWDARTANGVDEFIANSAYIGRRIWKAYRRESTVIYPPVDTTYFQPAREPRKSFYLAASRFVPYKRMDVIAEAFSQMPDRTLVMVGDGPELEKCKRRAASNVTFLGYQPSDVLRSLMQEARAFLFAAQEDFGIMPVEAMACGTPVLCYGHGGASESVIPGVCGLHFAEQTPASIRGAVEEFELTRLNHDEIRAEAEKFSVASFRARFSGFVADAQGRRQRRASDQLTSNSAHRMV